MRKFLFHQLAVIFSAFLLLGYSASALAQTTLATETFESPTGWFTNTFTGSNSVSATTRNQWIFATGGNAITSKSAQVSYTTNNGTSFNVGQYGNTSPNTAILLYKNFSSAGYDNISVQFDWKCRGESGFDYGQLYYATSAAGPWTQVATNLRVSNANTQNSTINLPVGANNLSTLHIAWVFRCDNSTVNQPGFIVDNITVRGTALPCAGNPSSLTSTAVTSNSSTISWTAGSPAPSSGYQYYVSTSATTPLAGQSPTGSTAAGITTANLTGLNGNTTYYYWVRSNCGSSQLAWVGSGTFTTLAPAPGNDLIANATTISCGQTLSGTSVGATADVTSPCSSTITTPAVWYKVTGNGQIMTISTCGLTSNDTRLQVFSGTTANLACVGSNDDGCSTQSTVTWTSVSGTTYYILAGLFSGTGTFGINLSCVNPPSADYAFTAPFNHAGNTCGAGNDCNFGASQDRQYAITVTSACSYTFSLCGASFDTYMYLTSALCGGTSIASNDDFCGLASQFTVALTPGTYYLVVESYSDFFTSPTCGTYTLNVTAGFSGVAGAISGSTNICGASSGTYSIPSVSGATNYLWSVPTGVSIQSGQGTNSVILNFSSSFAGGSISVLPSNSCGNGTASSLSLNATFADYSFSAPFTHSGNTCGMGDNLSIAAGEDAYYAITIPYACDWTFSLCGSSFDTYLYLRNSLCGGSTLISNDDYCGLQSQFTTYLTAGTYYLDIESYSSILTSPSCGAYTLNVSSNYSGVAGAINGASVVCTNSSSYSVSAVAGATSYTWSVPAGVTIASGQGTNSVTLNFAANFTTGSISVVPSNSCGSGVSSSKVINRSNVSASASATSIACNGGASVVTVTGSGGFAPYSGAGSYTVGAGTYNYTVTDANGCSASTSVTISQPSVLSASSTATSIACFGGTSTVTVTASGGTPPYTGIGNFTVSAGTYNYTVTDANGCIATTSVTVNQPALLQAFAANTPILCNGGTATVGVTFSGGTGVITGIGNYTVNAGTYTYNIADDNGCTASTTIIITEPSLLEASSNATTILCNGGSSDVTVSAAGGTLPYSGVGVYNVGAGAYSYTVTDGNGCQAITFINITEPALLVASSASLDYNGYGVSCYAGSNGEITVTATGGVSPYAGTGVNSNLSAGNYSYTVTDANGCVSTTNATITEPTKLNISATNTAILCNGGSSDVAVTSWGGVTPYTVNEAGIYSVPAGSYTYDVVDLNGCTASTTIDITEPALLTVDAGSDETVFYGYGPMQCADLSASAAGGTGAYSFSWMSMASGGGIGSTLTACPTNSEIYTVTVSDANGCIASDDLSICVIDVHCEAGNSGNMKVEMCQIPPGNPANAHTICIDASAVPAHLAIGCQLGACGELSSACSGTALKNYSNNAAIEELQAAVVAYPNPTENTTTISVTLTKGGNYSVEMFDMMGKLVKTVYAGSFEDYENLEFDVDMTNLNTGVYMISVSNGDQKIENIRVMKN